jgi:hypothetical protein
MWVECGLATWRGGQPLTSTRLGMDPMSVRAQTGWLRSGGSAGRVAGTGGHFVGDATKDRSQGSSALAFQYAGGVPRTTRWMKIGYG